MCRRRRKRPISSTSTLSIGQSYWPSQRERRATSRKGEQFHDRWSKPFEYDGDVDPSVNNCTWPIWNSDKVRHQRGRVTLSFYIRDEETFQFNKGKKEVYTLELREFQSLSSFSITPLTRTSHCVRDRNIGKEKLYKKCSSINPLYLPTHLCLRLFVGCGRNNKVEFPRRLPGRYQLSLCLSLTHSIDFDYKNVFFFGRGSAMTYTILLSRWLSTMLTLLCMPLLPLADNDNPRKFSRRRCHRLCGKNGGKIDKKIDKTARRSEQLESVFLISWRPSSLFSSYRVSCWLTLTMIWWMLNM